MLPSKLEDVTLDELQQLVDDAVPEGKPIEYKKEFYRLDSTDKDDKIEQHEELLKDVSSFANTNGGDLIIGMKSKEGIPIEVCGFPNTNPDGLKLRISELLQHHLEPRISVAMHPIAHSTGRIVLVIRVQQSTIGPHRVVYQRRFGQFWARNDAGVYRMDTSDLRRAFTSSKSVKDEITKFRLDRVDAIRDAKTPVPLPPGPKVICHILPLESFTSQVEHTMQAMENQLVNLPMLTFTGGWSQKYTEHGLVTCDSLHQPPSSGYVQLFRNGVIESVSAAEVTYTFPNYPQIPFFTSYYVQWLIRALPKYFTVLRSLGTVPPVQIFITLTGMQGVRIHVEHQVGTPFDRDVILLPVVEVPTLAIDDFASLLQSSFNWLWNTAGYSRCYEYRENGGLARH